MPRALALLTLLLATACGTPQENCIRAGTRDIRVMDRLIAESRATLARGYAIEEVQVERLVWMTCDPPVVVDGKVVSPARPCLEVVTHTERRPKSVNLAEERAKLASMEAKRRELDRAAAPLVAECKARHPE